MKLSLSSHAAALTLLLMIPAYGMEDESNTAIVPLSAKIQAGVAAAAPLLVCPPFMIAAVPAIAATISHLPTLTTRAGTATALTMPFKAAVTALGDGYIAPHSSIVNRVAKLLAGMYVAKCADQHLTRRAIIPAAPIASSLTEIACHTAVGYAVGAATEQIIYTPYDKFMRCLNADYKKKDGVIAPITQLRNLNSPQVQAAALQRWDPSTNPATKDIVTKSESSVSYENASLPERGISCKLSLSNGAILVSEGIWEKNSNRVSSSITRYTTLNTEWYYLQPFGTSTFIKEIKQLHRTVLANHVTTTGIPLKDIIQVTEESTDL